ncbi:hypothetical protein JKP88DRAFT_245856 [Tribonema minus]|uniref:Uncharacterized protein n=1 Tax=Tribonema minus TaxID=303371 RepID=A0A836CD16_9STRA|nr:hypothetical protein JKP88DRAFT_245856 [Tribonema minus]
MLVLQRGGEVLVLQRGAEVPSWVHHSDNIASIFTQVFVKYEAARGTCPKNQTENVLSHARSCCFAYWFYCGHCNIIYSFAMPYSHVYSLIALAQASAAAAAAAAAAAPPVQQVPAANAGDYLPSYEEWAALPIAEPQWRWRCCSPRRQLIDFTEAECNFLLHLAGARLADLAEVSQRVRGQQPMGASAVTAGQLVAAVTGSSAQAKGVIPSLQSHIAVLAWLDGSKRRVDALLGAMSQLYAEEFAIAKAHADTGIGFVSSEMRDRMMATVVAQNAVLLHCDVLDMELRTDPERLFRTALRRPQRTWQSQVIMAEYCHRQCGYMLPPDLDIFCFVESGTFRTSGLEQGPAQVPDVLPDLAARPVEGNVDYRLRDNNAPKRPRLMGPLHLEIAL